LYIIYSYFNLNLFLSDDILKQHTHTAYSATNQSTNNREITIESQLLLVGRLIVRWNKREMKMFICHNYDYISIELSWHELMSTIKNDWNRGNENYNDKIICKIIGTLKYKIYSEEQLYIRYQIKLHIKLISLIYQNAKITQLHINIWTLTKNNNSKKNNHFYVTRVSLVKN